jgi:hypothetical protein
MSAHPLLIDLLEAARFLAAIDWGAKFGFATFDDRDDDPRLAMRLFGDLSEAIRLTGRKRGQLCSTVSTLAFMQSLGAGVFFTVQSLDGGGATKQYVNAVRASVADADTDEQLASLREFIAVTGLEPSITVISGGLTACGAEKVHAYWLLRDCPIFEFPELQTILLSRTGTDPAVSDLARVMRLPGTWHLKSEARQTRVQSFSGNVHNYSDFRRRVQSAHQVCDPLLRREGITAGGRHGGSIPGVVTGSATARLRILLGRNGGLVTPSVRTLVREAVAPTHASRGNRHSTLVAIVTRLVRIGWPDTDIRQLVLPLTNHEWADGDWTAHLDRILVWTRSREADGLARTPRTT